MKQKKKILILMSALILLSFSGCGEVETRYIYINNKCPKLQTFEVNRSNEKHFTIHYKVKEVNESN